MFSFFKRSPTPERVQAELATIAMTMARLESYGFRPVSEVAQRLNKDFFLDVPSTEREVDGNIYLFPDPANWGLSLHCNDPFNPGKVTSYTLIGYEDKANCLVQGNTGDQGESFTWSISVESRHREIPPLTKALLEAFWRLPGYETLAMGNVRFLLRRMT